MKTKSNRLTFALAILVLSGAAILAPAMALAEPVTSFTAVSHGQEVFLQWATGQEAGIAIFQIQRSFDGRYYHTLHSVAPTGDNSTYSYIDSDLFKSNLQTFYYRIGVELTTRRVSYTAVERVEMAFSGIRKTWGSIKAMFR